MIHKAVLLSSEYINNEIKRKLYFNKIGWLLQMAND